MIKRMKVVPVEWTIAEVNFQKQRLIESLQKTGVNENTIEEVIEYFDVMIHGIEDHLPHYDLDIEFNEKKEESQ